MLPGCKHGSRKGPGRLRRLQRSWPPDACRDIALAGVGGGLDADRGRRRSDPMVRARDVAWVVISAEGERDGLLLERYRELERIGHCLQRARQGYGGALVVEGPAGIGKTVLLAAGRVAAQLEGFRVLRARGAELEREYAFGVVRQLFEKALAAATEQERPGLLDGPPSVAARLLSLPGLGDGARGERRSRPTPRLRSCTDCTGCAPTWPPSVLWR